MWTLDTAMDLCRVNERNAAALTLSSIGQGKQPKQEEVSSSPSGVSGTVVVSSSTGSSVGERMRATAGTTWLLVDNNNSEHAATTIIAQQSESGPAHPEHNINANNSLEESWAAGKQATVLEDGNIGYADVVVPHNPNDGLDIQSM